MVAKFHRFVVNAFVDSASQNPRVVIGFGDSQMAIWI